jgi:anti-sigma B factor antagonist
MQKFEIRQKELKEGVVEVQVIGELDLAVADQLGLALEEARQSGSSVLISLSDCEFIDSTGIAAIIDAWKRLGENGQRLVVAEPTEQVVRLLEIVGIADRGLVFGKRDEALEAVDGA